MNRPSPEQELQLPDFANVPLEELMPWNATDEHLDLLRSVRVTIGDEGDTTNVDQYLGSMAADFVMIAPRFDDMKRNLLSLKAGGSKSGNQRSGKKKSGARRSGNPAKQAAQVADTAASRPQDGEGLEYHLDELTRLNRLANRAYDFELALTQALSGEPGPLADLEPWGDNILPPNMTADQQLVVGRFKLFTGEARPIEPAELPELPPLTRVIMIRAADNMSRSRIATSREYLAALCVARVRTVADRREVIGALSSDTTKGRKVSGDTEKGGLSEWKAVVNGIPTLSRETVHLKNRTDVVIRIGSRMAGAFHRRVKPGPKDTQLAIVRNELSRAGYRQDDAEERWAADSQEIHTLFQAHKLAMHEAVEPWIENLREQVAKRNDFAKAWLDFEDEADPRREEVADSAPRLARLCPPEVDERKAREMLSLMTHLRDAALTEDEAEREQGYSGFLAALEYEARLTQGYDRRAVTITAHEVEVPRDLPRELPLRSTVQLILENWDDVWDIMSFRAGDQIRKSLEAVKSWLEHPPDEVDIIEEVED